MREVDLAVKRLATWMKDESGFWDSLAAFKLNSQSLNLIETGATFAL